jgi:hypothetical protein
MSYAKIAMAVLALGLGSANLAHAAGKGGGAMSVGPGQEFKGTTPAPVPDLHGASGWAPGQEMKAGVANPDPLASGASGYAPGTTISNGKI